MITLDRVGYVYGRNASPALSGLTFRVRAGERLAVIGASGAGKSTLGRLIAGLIQPTTGKIDRSDTAIVFQNPETQFVAEIVEDDVAFGPENLGLDSPEIRERIDRALEVVGGTSLRMREISGLSGGEKQRIALAGALAMESGCIILDEASAMLHPVARLQLEAAIERIRVKRRLTLIQMTHDVEEAARADRVLLLHQGQMKKIGPPGDVLGDTDLLEQCDIVPSEALLFAHVLKRHGITLDSLPLTVNSLVESIKKELGA